MESAVVNDRRLSWLNWIALWLLATPLLGADKIDAVKGKKYELSRQHGPWMIMVASLAEPPPEFREEGPGPAQAAADLAFELRKKGIPAYVFEQKEQVESLGTLDRNGKKVKQGIRTKDDRICVVAGNYPSAEDSVAQKTLKFLKTYKPQSFGDHASFRSTPGRPGPLSGAFLTINPLLSPEEIAQQKVDPCLLKINSDRKYSLLTNRGKYSLVVASFFGKSKMAGKSQLLETEEDDLIGKALEEAGQNAETLCQALRETTLHHGRQFDAFVWHEHARSLVCVGSFTSDKDPAIPRMYEFFAERKQKDARTQNDLVLPQYLLVPELDKANWVFPKLPNAVKRDRKVAPLPKHSFAFDPKPQLFLVPLSGGKSSKR